MIELNIAGIGAWSECFADWQGLQQGLQSGEWPAAAPLSPQMIPPRERRRAPQSVKMAVEVMSQACSMAGMPAAEPVVVFASAMGDMEITDAMCRTLADKPELVSPTRFHNSVHNAPIGYWSIATGSHAPANAIAGYDHSAALGLLEAAVQCAEERRPVLFLCQEGAAPEPLTAVRPSRQALALCLLLVPPGSSRASAARLRVEVVEASAALPDTPGQLPLDFSGNPAVALLPLFIGIADTGTARPAIRTHRLPLNAHLSLHIETESGEGV